MAFYRVQHQRHEHQQQESQHAKRPIDYDRRYSEAHVARRTGEPEDAHGIDPEPSGAEVAEKATDEHEPDHLEEGLPRPDTEEEQEPTGRH